MERRGLDMSSNIKNSCEYNDDMYDGNIKKDCIHHNTDLNNLVMMNTTIVNAYIYDSNTLDDNVSYKLCFDGNSK